MSDKTWKHPIHMQGHQSPCAEYMKRSKRPLRHNQRSDRHEINHYQNSNLGGSPTLSTQKGRKQSPPFSFLPSEVQMKLLTWREESDWSRWSRTLKSWIWR